MWVEHSPNQECPLRSHRMMNASGMLRRADWGSHPCSATDDGQHILSAFFRIAALCKGTLQRVMGFDDSGWMRSFISFWNNQPVL